MLFFIVFIFSCLMLNRNSHMKFKVSYTRLDSTITIHLGLSVSRLHRQNFSMDSFFPTRKCSTINTRMRYPIAMRNNTSKFSHLELLSGEMSYALRRACNPEILLTSPTSNEVSRYSFSKSPCNIENNDI